MVFVDVVTNRQQEFIIKSLQLYSSIISLSLKAYTIPPC